MIALILYVCIVGLVLGSFYNVVGLRIPAGQSIIRPRSACPSCLRTMGIRELIPVASYIWQKGKCLGCGARISPLYPSLELLHCLLFTLSFCRFGWSGKTIVAWTLLALLSSIVASDLRYMLIPNKILLFFLPLFIVEHLWLSLQTWSSSAAGASISFAVLSIIAVVSNGGMGGGDVKLFTLLGFVLGLQGILLALFLASLLGAVFGLGGMLLGYLQRKAPLPFGPFIALGAMMAYFFETELLAYYHILLSA